jgi:hypothetical protein
MRRGNGFDYDLVADLKVHVVEFSTILSFP